MLSRFSLLHGRGAGHARPLILQAAAAAPSSSSLSSPGFAISDGGSAARGFSTDAAAPIAKKVVKQRAVYSEQLTDLRKGWRDEMDRKKAREEQSAAAERQRLVLQKAIRLREQRKASAVRQEQAKTKREEALQLYREKLARNHVVAEKRELVQQQRYQQLAETLREESATWITRENMESKITEDLFSKPATTGLVTEESGHWRHHLMTINLRRVISPEFLKEQAGSSSSLADRLQQRGQIKSVKRLLVEDFLEPLIGTGKERAAYREILDKFAHEFQEMDVLDEDLDSYFEYIMNKDQSIDADSALYQAREEDEDGGEDGEEPEELDGLPAGEEVDAVAEDPDDVALLETGPPVSKKKAPFLK